MGTQVDRTNVCGGGVVIVATPEEILIEKQMCSVVNEALLTLKGREHRVLALRFGIHCQPHSLREIGAALGVGPERIRQIQSKAFRKLKSLAYDPSTRRSRVRHLREFIEPSRPYYWSRAEAHYDSPFVERKPVEVVPYVYVRPPDPPPPVVIHIKSTDPDLQGPYVRINESDFNPAIHQLYEE